MNDVMAVSLLKSYVDLYRKIDIDKRYLTKQGLECIETVLDLVEKQQKEIYRLNRKQADDEMLTDTFIERDYISRDKIREKINELEEQCKKELLTTWLESQIDILNELLEEN